MCYALPGPRCSGHTKTAMDKARKEFDDNPTPENKDAAKAAVRDYLETPDGIELLRKKGRDEEANAMERIRQRRLDAYNAANGKSPQSKAVAGSLKDKLDLAGNPDTPAAVMVKLVKDKNPKVRQAVAASTTRPAFLNYLSKDKDVAVATAVAGNQQTEAVALATVFEAHSSEASVVSAIARNPNCPSSLYPAIVTQPYPDFSRVVASRPDCPGHVLDTISSASHWSYRAAAAESPNASEPMLELLSRDPDHPVRRAVAMNARTELRVLQQMQDVEEHQQVQDAIRSSLMKRSV